MAAHLLFTAIYAVDKKDLQKCNREKQVENKTLQVNEPLKNVSLILDYSVLFILVFQMCLDPFSGPLGNWCGKAQVITVTSLRVTEWQCPNCLLGMVVGPCYFKPGTKVILEE